MADPDPSDSAIQREIEVECYARIGELKAGHRRKLAMDALKLLAIRRVLPDHQHIRSLLVVPEDLLGRLNGDGWFPVAIRLAAEVVPMLLLASEQRRLLEATALQAQGQSRTATRGEDRRE